jgi:glycosyltransferase involved in cell wall biosynthesis
LIWKGIKKTAFFCQDVSHNNNNFVKIEINNKIVNFSKGPLIDQRGIGRVSQALLKQLTSHSEVIGNNRIQGVGLKKNIYFYSSIHWCPDVLPKHSIVMIHDVIPLIFPEIFKEANDLWMDRYKAIAQQADVIVTISESSANDIAQFLEISKEKIKVIFNGITKLEIKDKTKVEIPKTPYLVFLGTHDFHKNVDVVLKALNDKQLRDVSLAMIGDNQECQKRIFELGLNDRVYFFGRLSDSETGYIIKHALALAFPSLYEGFGLPPFEAAMHGTPSICSRRPAMTELLNDAVLFADPNRVEQWISATRQLIDDPELRNKLATVAHHRAKTYTWEKSATELIALFSAI